MIKSLKTAFDYLFQGIVIVLMTVLAVVVLVGITYRTAGAGDCLV